MIDACELIMKYCTATKAKDLSAIARVVSLYQAGFKFMKNRNGPD